MSKVRTGYGGNPIVMYRGDTSGNGPSKDLWADCPWFQAFLDPNIGYGYYDDFLGPIDPTDDDGWAITYVTTGELSAVDMAGGGLLVDSAGHTTADDGIEAVLVPESWIPAAGKPLWFEARVKFSDVATTPDQFFIGLAENQETRFATGALDESDSLIGFYTDVNSTAASLEFITCKSSSSEIDTAIATVANNTFYKLGFKVFTDDGQLKVAVWIDGVEQVDDLVTDTDDIPIEEMALALVAKIEQTSADAEMTVDWVRIFQMR